MAHQDGWCRAAVLGPFSGPRDQRAVIVAGGDVQDGDRRQRAWPHKLLAAPGEQAFILEFAQKVLQFHPILPTHGKSLGDITLGRT